MCDMTHSYVWHDSFICVTWLIHMCDMTHSSVWHDSFICVTWLHLLLSRRTWPATWLIHMCDITHAYVWHHSFICVTWLIRMCGMTHLYVWQNACICVTWLIHMCDMTHSNAWHDSFISVTWLHLYCCRRDYGLWRDSSICVQWLIQKNLHLCDLTHSTKCICEMPGLCVSHIHIQSSLYLPLASVNLVLKIMGTPDEISSPPGWNRISPGCPRNFNTELTEPTRQIKTTFPMNMSLWYAQSRLEWFYVTVRATYLIAVCDVTQHTDALQHPATRRIQLQHTATLYTLIEL